MTDEKKLEESQDASAIDFEKVLELINFLADPKVTTKELTQFLSERTFSRFSSYAVYVNQLLPTGEIALVDSFGLPTNITSNWARYPITADVPSADAIREDRIVWLADREEWDLMYPQARNYSVSTALKTLINTPIYLTGSLVGGMGVMCAEQILPSPARVAFLDIVAGLVSLHRSRASALNPSTMTKGRFLTFRQREVLRMLSLQYTNGEIANQIGYSLSTIRQETMRIYEILGVSNRREAVEKAYQLELL